MSRLVGNQRKASALETTTGYNQGMQASCLGGHVCPPKQLACVLKSPLTQLNASNTAIVSVKILISGYYWLKKDF